MKRTKKELQTILKSINEMITIPMFNKFNLSKDELKEMRKQIKLEIDKLDNKLLDIEQYANQRVIEEVERWRNSKLQDHYPEAVDVSEFDRRIKELKQ